MRLLGAEHTPNSPSFTAVKYVRLFTILVCGTPVPNRAEDLEGLLYWRESSRDEVLAFFGQGIAARRARHGIINFQREPTEEPKYRVHTKSLVRFG
jgi:hypothetical protein